MMFGTELAVAVALLAPAQQPQKSGDSGGYTLAARQAAQTAAVYEDIEIMRRLLARKLAAFGVAHVGPLYGPITSSAAPANGPVNAALDATANTYLGALNDYTGHAGEATRLANSLSRNLVQSVPVEGVHLDRGGVVFTLTLPPHGDPRPNATKTAPAPAGEDWEKMRKELRGEKSDAGTSQPGQPPTVGDVVLRALAENGKHFRSLGADERLTVVVTFRRPVPNQPHSPSPYPLVKTQNSWDELRPWSRPTGSDTNPAAPAGASTAHDLELLADLHLKQQQYDQALDAVRKAVALVEIELKQNPGGEQSHKRLADLYTKQAQAFLATGRLDEARAALERTRQINLDLKATPNAPSKATQPEAVKLPAKLIVSAPKVLLDAVGGGKIDYEAFRQQVSVEYLTFGQEKPKSNKQ